MPKYFKTRWRDNYNIAVSVFILLISSLFIYIDWMIGIVVLILGATIIYYSYLKEVKFNEQIEDYILTLSHRIKKAGNEVFDHMPIGVILFNDKWEVEWHNPFVKQIFNEDHLLNQSLHALIPELEQTTEWKEPIQLQFSNQRYYQVEMKLEERCMYIIDRDDYTQLLKRYENEKLAIGIIQLDNIDEVSQGMNDEERSIISAKLAGLITHWANEHKMYIRRIAADKYLIILVHEALVNLQEDRFSVLDDARELTQDYKLPVTLSIGIAAGDDNLTELGKVAQASLDIALGRGGDQVAVKIDQQLSFFGGKSNAIEKRTRVRARVISHALRNLIHESENVIIMGHRFPDMDSVGAAIGILRAVKLCNKEGYIVIEHVNESIARLMDELKKEEDIFKWIITPDEAMQIMTQGTLAVVVDTHKLSMVAEPKLVEEAEHIVVIDHHRRGAEFMNDAVLIYTEPYASSACELVTELLQYFDEKLRLSDLEANAMLGGIIVDTKSFALRTGFRTFEAAAFLRRQGADSTVVHRMLKEDLQEYVQKAEVIKNAEILLEHVAIATTTPGQEHAQLTAAKVADTLLNMNNIMASFVIYERGDGLVGVSARSLGEINVQVIMEQLGGGGHLTNAATQMEGTVEEIMEQLKSVIETKLREEGLLT
ncbi:DHH family phosphoesterase [Longirhabdus pacifica]|uniref:DHH family phosphoesterase n=1 Tax=Longirhabdus pacifica TaxID=2305227 RepID=UPI001008DE44|nr:DHH family phosphoesterase [Longirhabdus pacifica]